MITASVGLVRKPPIAILSHLSIPSLNPFISNGFGKT
jgi:hypothetical protein